MTQNHFEGTANTVVQAGSVAFHHHYGARRHLIEEFPPPDTSDLGWLMAQPSRLLDARRRVVAFSGRDAELGHLADWRDTGGTGLSVLLLHAPGGQGKTRLAAEFAELTRRGGPPDGRRWRVLQARLGAAPAPGLVPPATPAPAAAGTGTLLVVDYADRWAHSELLRLLADPALRPSGPVRVLLVGRTVRWYAALRAELAARGAAAGDHLLPSPAGDRLAVFEAARDRFAGPDLYDLPDAARIGPPGPLDQPDFGLVLTVHMAALAAVDAAARGRRAPAAPHELSAYLLDREYLAWQQLADAQREGQDYRTRPSVMAKTVFVAALTGAVGHGTGAAVLRRLDLPGHPEDLLLDHRFCYPSTDRGQVLEPLYPDRLAEDFLGLLTPGHQVASYEPDPWTTAVPGLLMGDDGLRPVLAPRLVTMLAAAADRWPHLGEQVLHPLIGRDPRIAFDGGSAALAALAGLDGLPPSLLEVLHVLPEYWAGLERQVDLDVGIAAVAERVTERRLAATADPARRAELLLTLGLRLSNAGRREQALAAVQEAVRIHRGPAGRTPADPAPLAVALVELGVGLAALGRRQEALAATAEAVELYRRPAAGGPTARRRAQLATALGNLGSHLALLGRPEEALAPAREAAEILRQLAEEDPETWLPAHARALNGLAAELMELGRHREALTPAYGSVEIRRRLAQQRPARHLPDLALALQNFNTAARALIDALAPADRGELLALVRSGAEESVAILRRLVRTNPAAFRPDLAAALHGLGAVHHDLGRHEEALTALEEAVALGREEAAAGSDAALAGLARSLQSLGTVQSALGRRGPALTAADEAFGLYSQLAAVHPEAYRLEVGRSLEGLAAELAAAGKADAAIRAYGEAAELVRPYAARQGQEHLRDLARILHHLGAELVAAGRHPQALPVLEEAVDAGRRAPRQPATSARLAACLYLTAVCRFLTGRRAQAAEPAKEALGIRRELARSGSHPGPRPGARHTGGTLTIDPGLRGAGEIRAHLLSAVLLGDGGPGPALLDDIVVKDPELFVRVVQLLAQEPDPRPGVR